MQRGSKEGFITKYIFSQDHKMIAKQFLVTGIIWAIIGALFSILFRLQLGHPNESFPLLETILGKWAKGGILTPDGYYALVTMHGTIMIFFLLTAGLSGTFANFLIPLQVGARDMASPFLNMLSYWFFFAVSVVMLASLFFTSTLGLLSFPVLLSAFVLLLFDRNFGTSFYLSDIFLSSMQRALPAEGGSAILYQHLFWFLGHPEVYIVILPAMGIVSEVISVNARKPIFGYMAMVGSLFAIVALSFFVWARHMFVSGLNPFLGSIFVLLKLLIAIPSAVKVFNWLATLWRGSIRFTPAMLFSIGFVSLFISGGLTGIWLGNSTLDIQLHDTYLW